MPVLTEVYAVVGMPVAHSLSPAMHNAAFQAEKMHAVYAPFEVKPEDLAVALRGFAAAGVRGFNVTLPHKSAIIPLLEEVDPLARAVGAVNTVVRTDGRWVGTNTDVQGLARALLEAGIGLEDKHVVVLGAGGAARAAVMSAFAHRARSVTCAARREDAARAVLMDLDGARPVETSTEVVELSARALQPAFARADVILQATSATLGEDGHGEAFVKLLPLQECQSETAVVDLAYRSRATVLVSAAKELGLVAFDGRTMLLHQGGLAFEYWFNRPAPISAMRAALLYAIGELVTA